MFKKTMAFDDLNGDEVQQTFYFNYNKKEIAELLEFKQLEEKIKLLQTPVSESGLSQQENNQQAYDIFQGLILDAYGEKGADNVTFKKTPELRAYWASHVAFVEMIFEFLENPTLAATFIENCLPGKLVARAKAEMAAEAKGQVSSETLHEMVQEAARRQEDPATRIEPGDASHLEDTPEVKKLAEKIVGDLADAGVIKQKAPEDLTADDINKMDDETFKKIDMRRLSKEQMLVAFQRRSQM